MDAAHEAFLKKEIFPRIERQEAVDRLIEKGYIELKDGKYVPTELGREALKMLVVEE